MKNKHLKNEKLPTHWTVTTLDHLCFKPQYGWTTRAANVGEVKFIRTTDISTGKLNWDKVPFCELPPPDLSQYQVQENDILLSRSGSVGLSYLIDEKVNFKAVFASYMIRLRTTHPTIAKYISYFFHSEQYWTQITNITTGDTIPNINGTNISNISIPLASIEEQEKIIQKLDKLSGKLNNIDRKRASIDELEEKAFRTFIFEQEELFSSVKIGEYCTEKTKRIGKNWKGKQLIGVSNEYGITDLRIGQKATFEKYKIVYPGDFIYNPMRVNIGSIAIWEGPATALTSPDYIVFSINHTISPILILKYLKSAWGLSEINNYTKGSVRSRLYFKNLAKIDFPFCGNEGQKEAQIVLESFQRIRSDSHLIRNKLQAVMSEGLKRAFSGKLVVFNKKTTPISGLLKKIEQSKKVVMAQKIKTKKQSVANTLFYESNSIIDILSRTREPMIAKDVWIKSMHENNIDEFYSELKRLIEIDALVEEIKMDNQHYLKLVS